MLPAMLIAAAVGGAPAQATAQAFQDRNGNSTAGDTDLALSSIRITTAGAVEDAGGDEEAPLSYTARGFIETLMVGYDNTAWEAKVVVDSEADDAGTWLGSTRGSFIDVDSQQTWTWKKDTDSVGVATAEITVSIRHKVNTSNIDTKAITLTSREL